MNPIPPTYTGVCIAASLTICDVHKNNRCVRAACAVKLESLNIRRWNLVTIIVIIKA